MPNFARLVGTLVQAPSTLPAPTRYLGDRKPEHRCDVGVICDGGENLLSVQWFGYPRAWDYGLRDALSLIPNNNLDLHPLYAYLPPSEPDFSEQPGALVADYTVSAKHTDRSLPATADTWISDMA